MRFVKRLLSFWRFLWSVSTFNDTPLYLIETWNRKNRRDNRRFANRMNCERFSFKCSRKWNPNQKHSGIVLMSIEKNYKNKWNSIYKCYWWYEPSTSHNHDWNQFIAVCWWIEHEVDYDLIRLCPIRYDRMTQRFFSEELSYYDNINLSKTVTS